MKAKIKIEITSDNKTEVSTNEETLLVKKDNKYYFSLNGESQELVVTDTTVSIVRPEMTLDMELNKIIKNEYKNKVQQLSIFFKLIKINTTKNSLNFAYEIYSSKEPESFMQRLSVEINY